MCQELMQGAEDRWANVMCGAFEHNTFTAGQQKLEEHEFFTLNCDDDNDCGRERSGGDFCLWPGVKTPHSHLRYPSHLLSLIFSLTRFCYTCMMAVKPNHFHALYEERKTSVGIFRLLIKVTTLTSIRKLSWNGERRKKLKSTSLHSHATLFRKKLTLSFTRIDCNTVSSELLWSDSCNFDILNSEWLWGQVQGSRNLQRKSATLLMAFLDPTSSCESFFLKLRFLCSNLMMTWLMIIWKCASFRSLSTRFQNTKKYSFMDKSHRLEYFHIKNT